MKNILIAEDDVIIRMGIVNCIEWSRYGYHKPFEASNGEEALSILENHVVDICLVDIKMPKMDGIGLISKLKEREIHTKIIIFSCHNEFEYARQALKLGASDFLVKQNSSPADIIDAIQKAEIQINIGRSVDRTADMETDPDAGNAKKMKFLRGLIEGNGFKSDEFEIEKHELGLEIDVHNIALIDIVIVDGISPLNSRIMSGKISRLIEDKVKDVCQNEVVFLRPHEYVLLVSPSTNSSKQVYSLCVEITKRLEAGFKDCGVGFCIAVSSFFHNMHSVGSAYRETVALIQSNPGVQKSIFFLNETVTRAVPQSKVNIKEYLTAINCIEPYSCVEEVDKIFKDLITKFPSMEDAVEVGVNIISRIVKRAGDSGNYISIIYEEKPFLYTELYRFKSVSEIEEYVLGIAEYVEGMMSRQYPLIINEAMRYIKANIHLEDLNLEKVALHLKISRNYFSYIFKDKTGESFVDFISKERIRKAEELFKNSNLKVYEVSEMVGYKNWRYFCRVYKKYTGKILTDLKR